MPACSVCNKEFPRSEFAKAQLKKSPDHRKCKTCAIITMIDPSSGHQQETQQQENSPSDLSVIATKSAEEDVAAAATTTINTATTQTAETKTIDASAASTTTSKIDVSPSSPTEDVATLQAEISILQTQLQELQTAHQKNIQQVESKAMERMDRTIQRIVHLEALAKETTQALQEIQRQASSEIGSLQTQLATVTSERDALKQEKAATEKK